MTKLRLRWAMCFAQVTLLVSGWTGTMSYPPNSKNKTFLESHKHKFLQKEKRCNYRHSTKRGPQGFTVSHLHPRQKSCWLRLTVHLEMLQNWDPPRSYSFRPISHLVLGGWSKGRPPVVRNTSYLCSDLPELVSFFPSISFVTGLQTSPGPRWNTVSFSTHVWIRIKDSFSWLTHILGPLKPGRRTGHGL